MFYVYRFIDKNGNIIYVGKTKTSIENRMRQHFGSSGHLPQDCYSKVNSIEYAVLKSKIDMDIKELYYINKWKPLYNSKDKQEEELSLIINEEDVWAIYQNKEEEYIEKLEKENNEYTQKIKEYEKQLNKYLEFNNYLKNQRDLLTNKIETLEQKQEVKFVFNGNKGKSRDKSKVYSLKEIETVFKYIHNCSFTTTIHINSIEKYRFVIYFENDKILAKEILSDYCFDFKESGLDSNYWTMRVLIEQCEFLVDDSNIVTVERILSKYQEREPKRIKYRNLLDNLDHSTFIEVRNKVADEFTLKMLDEFIDSLWLENEDVDLKQFLYEWIHKNIKKCA